ncbi:hypothetical protein BC828DRAFT_233702 [Blastocladiella britannica]|nr:hypothetical protein BC828DRAFT_233702 [Blastocladiella britannica]
MMSNRGASHFPMNSWLSRNQGIVCEYLPVFRKNDIYIYTTMLRRGILALRLTYLDEQAPAEQQQRVLSVLEAQEHVGSWTCISQCEYTCVILIEKYIPWHQHRASTRELRRGAGRHEWWASRSSRSHARGEGSGPGPWRKWPTRGSGMPEGLRYRWWWWRTTL